MKFLSFKHRLDDEQEPTILEMPNSSYRSATSSKPTKMMLKSYRRNPRKQIKGISYFVTLTSGTSSYSIHCITIENQLYNFSYLLQYLYV